MRAAPALIEAVVFIGQNQVVLDGHNDKDYIIITIHVSFLTGAYMEIKFF